MGLYALCLIVVTVQAIYGSHTYDSDVTKDAHAILKRFADAEQEFTNHEIADVLHQREPNSFHRISKRDLRSVTEDNNVKRLRLDLSSGSSLHLNLKKRSLFGSDTQHFYNTERGRVKRQMPLEDCYATGDVEVDGKSEGTAVVATCDGLHGTVISNGVEYYIHPVETIQGEHKVHVLSRRASQDSIDSGVGLDDVYSSDEKKTRYKRDTVTAETYKTAEGFVIELAIFVDSRYRARLEAMVPGREDEYVLMGVAAVQAMYSDKDKVGYDALFKVKLFMNWIVDPEGYDFQEDIFNNLRQFREVTKDKYKYDMHFLHTGVIRQKGPAVGVAYVGAVCTVSRCANMYTINYNRFSTMAHEIGHNLGFGHHGTAKCPDDIKALGGGFMGGPNGNTFSPCNKWELYNLFSKGKGQCLFEETANKEAPEDYVNQPSVFPGQYKSPDEQCRMLAGEGYEFYRPFDLRGVGECSVWMCINLDIESPEYLRVVKRNAQQGYTCGDEMFCKTHLTCVTWDTPEMGWDVDYLRAQRRDVTWSEWPEEWSECSGECGPGVQFKRRRCNINNGTSLSPYCRGPLTQARLCNNDPCPGNPVTVTDQEIRQARGNEVCDRFYRNNVPLRVKANSSYLPKAKTIYLRDSSSKYLETKSCMLICERDPIDWNNLDAIFPDGTPCTDSDKNLFTRQRYNIDLRCVHGVCTEMSDCPGHEEKDVCGVCGGDPIRCVSKVIDAAYDVPNGEKSVLAVLPAGTTGIDINMKWVENKGVRFEVWNGKGEIILGAGGLFKGSKFKGDTAVEYAGTKWTFEHASYVRADGPTDQEMVVKASRKGKPIKRIYMTYLLPQD